MELTPLIEWGMARGDTIQRVLSGAIRRPRSAPRDALPVTIPSPSPMKARLPTPPPIPDPKIFCSFWDAAIVRERYQDAYRWAYYALAMADHLGELPFQSQRECLWYTSPAGKIVTGFSWWFGGFSDWKVAEIRDVLKKLVKVFQSGSIKLYCSDHPDAPLCVACSGKNVAASHVIEGKVCVCSPFFTETPTFQTLAFAHELTHGINRLVLMDTHWCDGELKKWYADDVIKLRDKCPDKTVHNIDTYAYFLMEVGLWVDACVAWHPTPVDNVPPKCTWGGECGIPWQTPSSSPEVCEWIKHPGESQSRLTCVEVETLPEYAQPGALPLRSPARRPHPFRRKRSVSRRLGRRTAVVARARLGEG